MEGAISPLTSMPDIFYILRVMFDESTDLSPDLEWMLQSDQVDIVTLAEVLAYQYYQRIYNLSLTCLTYPAEAHKAAQETIIRAVLRSKQYHGDKDIYSWLTAIANEDCQARKIHQEAHKFLNPRLIVSIMKPGSGSNLTPRQLAQAVAEIKRKVQDLQQTKDRRAGYQELALLGIAIFVAFFLFRLAAYFTSPTSVPEELDQSTLNQELTQFDRVDAVDRADPLAANPPAKWLRGIPPQEPLSRNSNHEEIWRRLLLSRYSWKTMWVDLTMTLSGPADYYGPPIAERHQLWFDQEFGGLHLSGPLNGKADGVERITPGSTGYRPTIFHFDDFARLGSQIPWFYLSDEMSYTPYMFNFFLIADYDFPPHSIIFQAIGEEEWSGQWAVVVDVSDRSGKILARQWLDSTTGIVLRELFFDAGTQGRILLETNIAKIAFDKKFSTEFLQKADQSIIAGGFAGDITGEPESTGKLPGFNTDQALSSRGAAPFMPPPAGFDFSQSHLTFASGSYHGDQSGGSTPIFANSYYLGELELIDPFRILCVRSQIGDKIAISQWSRVFTSADNGVRIYDLENFGRVEYAIPDSFVRNLAFSPDDRYIAVSSLDQRERWWNPWRIYIIDTESGERIDIPEIEHIWSLAWSPDGTRLAGLRWPGFRYYSQSILRVYVYDLLSGEINAYLLDSDFPWGSTEVNVPLQDWNANFSLTMGGLEACASPP
jgi:hypothetical protein